MGKTKILGQASATASQMAAYLLSVNPAPKISMAVKDFCQLYLDTAAKEGIRGDALFAQACKETGNFNFRGTVKPEQNNFAGLGTTDTSTPGASFPDVATGILAQAQHAKAYATKENLSCPCVDPRYSLLVKYGKAGTAQYWEELGGKWAVPGYDTMKYGSLEAANSAGDSYGYQIIQILDKILKMPKEAKPVEKKKIIAIDAGHGMGTSGKRCLKSIDPAQTREWYLNDRISDRVQTQLAAYDCTVLRVDDTTGVKDISLSARVNEANNAGADFYMSIHHNAGINGGSGGGTVVFYYNNSAMRTMAERLYNAVVARTGLVGNRSSKVAVGDLYVIRNTTMPALLLENGFMDSTHDTPIILTAAHAEKTAQGIVDFLVAELNLKKTGSQIQEKPSPESMESLPYVTVGKEDTLFSIGRKLDIPWKDIADLNSITSPYTIYAGQKLRIPNKTTVQEYYPAYTANKTTLAVALYSLGIDNSFSFRSKIAKTNGITGYIGMATQNTQMYNLLVAGLLKRA